MTKCANAPKRGSPVIESRQLESTLRFAQFTSVPIEKIAFERVEISSLGCQVGLKLSMFIFASRPSDPLAVGSNLSPIQPTSYEMPPLLPPTGGNPRNGIPVLYTR
eukprot:1194519-Prorocentrum_minimum.AAC.4